MFGNKLQAGCGCCEGGIAPCGCSACANDHSDLSLTYTRQGVSPYGGSTVTVTLSYGSHPTYGVGFIGPWTFDGDRPYPGNSPWIWERFFVKCQESSNRNDVGYALIGEYASVFRHTDDTPPGPYPTPGNSTITPFQENGHFSGRSGFVYNYNPFAVIFSSSIASAALTVSCVPPSCNVLPETCTPGDTSGTAGSFTMTVYFYYQSIAPEGYCAYQKTVTLSPVKNGVNWLWTTGTLPAAGPPDGGDFPKGATYEVSPFATEIGFNFSLTWPCNQGSPISATSDAQGLNFTGDMGALTAPICAGGPTEGLFYTQGGRYFVAKR